MRPSFELEQSQFDREVAARLRRRALDVVDHAERLVLGASHRIKFVACEQERRRRAVEWGLRPEVPS